MVAFSKLAFAFSAIATSIATPLVERGEPDFILERSNASLSARQAPNYNQDYTTGGTVNYSPSTNAFSVSWNTQNDFVVGRGWTTGNTAPITFGGSFSVTGGTGMLSVYGWTTNPLVEYYVIENSANPPSFGTQKGTVSSDGATYTIWENTRVNQPSITGTATFNQYISVRSSKRSSGTVTIQNHFNAWKSLGLNLGTQNYQVVAVEGWGGSGSAQQSVSKSSGGGSPPPPPPPPPPGGGGSGCSALWGQCGGQGWTGPTCCSSGTCHSSNQWYSQCTN
ncbi:glycosyl hydrolases family 11-domain-containing protein [Xylogone sp. PMI_703]|nr:glycosyl hydrolases family 11-domain-containing protein [Xylogone sp. PMI_703]